MRREVTMESVALPTATGTRGAGVRREPHGGPVRAAAHGDRAAFEAVYQLHAQPAWRLASVLAAGDAEATAAVAGGFARALRSAPRRHVAGGGAARLEILGGVYRSALAQVREAVTDRPPPGGGVLAGAFRGLPERWRAALWLSAVDDLEAPAIAVVLGVTPADAAALADRGGRSLATRLEAAGVAPPCDLAPALLDAAGPPPAGLAEAVAERWRHAVVADPAARLGVLGCLVGERSHRTLAVASAGLLAVAVIGLGLLNPSPPGSLGRPLVGAAGSGTAGGLPAGSGASGGGPGRAGASLLGPARGSGVPPGFLSAEGRSGPGRGGSAPGGSTPGPAPGSSPAGAGAGNDRPGGSSGGPGSGNPGSGGSTGPGRSSRRSSPRSGGLSVTGGTAVTVAGVGSVSAGAGGAGATVTPGGTSVAAAQLCPDGVSLSALGITSLSQCPPSSTTTTTTTTTPTTAPTPTPPVTLPAVTPPPVTLPPATVPSGTGGSGGCILGVCP